MWIWMWNSSTKRSETKGENLTEKSEPLFNSHQFKSISFPPFFCASLSHLIVRVHVCGQILTYSTGGKLFKTVHITCGVCVREWVWVSESPLSNQAKESSFFIKKKCILSWILEHIVYALSFPLFCHLIV